MLYLIEYFFWIIAMAGAYIAFRFHKSKDKKNFFRSSLALSIIGTIGMLTIAIVIVNAFFSNPPLQFKIEKSSARTNEKILAREKYLQNKIETDFLNPDYHYQFINTHFNLPTLWQGDTGYIYRDDHSIINFYWDKAQFTEKEYSNLGHFGLGLIYTHINKNREALENYKQISNKSMKYLNYELGLTYLNLKDKKTAAKYFEAETKVKGGLVEKAYNSLIPILAKEKEDKKLTKMLNDPITKKYIDPELAVKLYFKDLNISSYYSTLLKLTFYHLTLTGILAASFILLVWLFYIIRIDVYEREKLLPIFLTLIMGMLFAFGSIQLTHFNEYYLGYGQNGNKLHDFLFSIFGIGAVEELVKIIPFLIILAFSSYINEAFDYILYASVSALGFAFIENIIYFEGSSTIIHGRALTAVVGHMFNSSLIAYGLVLSKFRYKGSSPLLFFGIFFLLGSISHGLYDFLLFNHIIPVFILFFLFTITIWIVLINNCLNNSSYFSYRKKVNTEKLQLYMAIALTAVLVFEYIAVALDQGPAIANNSLMNSVFTGSFLIIFFTSKLSRFDHVKNYWITLKYRGPSAYSISRIIGWMILGDIKPHNFVGREVEIELDIENSSEIMNAKIVDRLVVTCRDINSSKEYKDPYWFVLNLSYFSNTLGTDHLIIRFEDEQPNFTEGERSKIKLYTFPYLLTTKKESIREEDFVYVGKGKIKLPITSS